MSEAELTDPLGRLLPSYSLGTELVIHKGGGTGSNIKDSDIAETLANRPDLFGTSQEQTITDAVNTAKGIRGYHGSPHYIGDEGFQNRSIGTGEGVQAYGHGHYFAESEPTAKYYRDALADQADPRNAINDVIKQFKELNAQEPTHENIADWMKDTRGLEPYSKDERITKRVHSIINAQDDDDAFHNYKELDNLLPPPSKGHMYQVHIDAHPDHFLDWDHDLNHESNWHTSEMLPAVRHYDRVMNEFDHSPTGAEFHDALVRHLGSQESAANYLSKVGIHGIKYLDKGSRGAGDGTRNYVVFDPKDIEIMRRYARGGDVSLHHAVGGRTMGNNATDNALRMAHYDEPIDMPKSLSELQNWGKTHPANKPSMDSMFTNRMTGIEGAEPIAMPANLDELLAYLRSHHHSGGRAHFDDGGDVRADSLSRSEQASSDRDTASAESAATAERQSRNDALSQQTADQMAGQMGRGAGEGNGLAAAIGSPVGGIFGFAPRFNVADYRAQMQGEQPDPANIIQETTQRLTTPYQGTLMRAVQDPSTAFGMAYPSLVGVKNTPAGAAAILANLGYESNQSGQLMNPNAIAGGGYGIAQWTDPARRAEFFNAMNTGINTSDPIGRALALGQTTQSQQLGYGLNEIQQKYPQVAREMATATSIPTATQQFMTGYENPASNESLDARIALANQIARGTGVGQFAQAGLNAPPTSSVASNLSPGSISNYAKSILGAGGAGANTLDSSLAQRMAVNDTINSGAIIPDATSSNPSTVAAASDPLAKIKAEDAVGLDRKTADTAQPSLLERIFGSTSDQIAKLEAQGQTTTYPDAYSKQFLVDVNGNPLTAKDMYAYNQGLDPNSPEDMAKIQSRIVNYGQGPQVDYYTKSLGQALFGNLFGGNQAAAQTNQDQAIQSALNTARGGGGGGQQMAMAAPAAAAAAPQPPFMSQLSSANLALPNTEGVTAQQWANKYVGGDLSKVNARIKFVNGAPMLEYYA